jgi:hypothetical protein
LNGFRVTEHITADGVLTVGANRRSSEKVMAENTLSVDHQALNTVSGEKPPRGLLASL